MKSLTRALPLLLLLAGTAVADGQPAKPPSPTLEEMGRSLKNALTEEETKLLLEYMRDSVWAAFKDEEVTLPPDLAFKLEVLAQRLKKQSNYYLENLLKELEEDISRALKEKLKPGPDVPYQSPAEKLLPPAPPPPVPQPAPAQPNPYLPPAWIVPVVPWWGYPAPQPALPDFTLPAIPWFNPAPAPEPCPNCPNTQKTM